MSSGAVTLSQLLEAGRDRLEIACEECNRRGVYSVRGLLAEHGDLGLPDLLAQVTRDCSRRAAVGIHNRCKANYPALG